MAYATEMKVNDNKLIQLHGLHVGTKEPF